MANRIRTVARGKKGEQGRGRRMNEYLNVDVKLFEGVGGKLENSDMGKKMCA